MPRAFWLVALFLLGSSAAAQEKGDAEVAAIRVLIAKGEWAQAERDADALVTARTDKGDAPSLFAARHVGAAARLAAAKIDKAATELEAILKCDEKTLPASHPVRLRAANDQAVILFHQAKYAAARDLFVDTYAKRAKALGGRHPDTLQTLRNLAFAEEKAGDHEAYQKHLRACFDAMVDNLREGGPFEFTTSAEAVPLLESKPRFPRILIVRGFYHAPPKDPKLTLKKDEAVAQILDRLGMMATQLPRENVVYFQGKSHRLHQALYGDADFRTQVAFVNRKASSVGSLELKEIEQLEEAWAKKMPGHPWPTTVQRHIGLSYLELNRLADAMKLLNKAGALRLKVFGKDHPAYADVAEAQALVTQQWGYLDYARNGLMLTWQIRNRSLGAKHPETATARNALGVVQYYRGEFALARANIEAALAIRRDELGKEHVDTARSIADLATLLREEGDFVAAKKILEEAVVLLEKALGKYDAEFQAVRGNLEVLRMDMGDFDGATRYFTDVVKNKDTPDLAKGKALLNLGTIARARGDLDLARKIYEEALATNTFDAPFILNNLGSVSRDQDKLDEAQAYFEKALAAHKSRDGGKGPGTAFSLTSLGILAQKQGKLEKAEDYFGQALDLYRVKVGGASQATANLYQYLGTTQMLLGKVEAARKSLHEALAIKAKIARDILPTMSEAEALAFAASLEERDALLDVYRGADADASAAYEAAWTTRALATRAITARRQVVSLDPKARVLWEQLRKVRSRLAVVVRAREKDFNFQEFGGAYAKEMVSLNERKEKLEQELAALVKGRSRDEVLLSARPEHLLKALPAGVAVVDLLKARSWKESGKAKSASWAYDAFVLKAGDKKGVAWVSLGAAEPIDKQVHAWRSYYGNSKSASRGFRPDKAVKKEGADADRRLRELVWDKLAGKLEGCHTVLIIGDGELHRLPWGVLPGAKPGTFLIEEVAIATASHGPQLVALLEGERAAGESIVLAGGIVYDKAAKPRAGPIYRGVHADLKTRSGWDFLPGTAEETSQIAKLASKGAKVVALGGVEATPGSLRAALPKARHVHLATHGYFSKPAEKTPWNVTATMKEEDLSKLISARLREEHADLAAITGRNPLILSGLVLAGANGKGASIPADDGILTAEEIVDLPLAGLDLVVLSACETGLGEVAGGEGVLGLQRAFSLAGARGTIGSLWKVDDSATQALMVEFYRNFWQKKMGKLEALRQAQITMLRDYDPKAGRITAESGERRVQPYYWAAFVLQGDWR